MAFLKPSPLPSLALPSPEPAKPPVFGETQAKAKPKPKSAQTSFLGSELAPSSSNLGTATLLGGV